MKKLSLIAILLFLTTFFLVSCEKEDDSHKHSLKFHALNTTMRALWSDHALWTRNVIINIVDDMPGTDQAVGRLLQNQEDIGNAIKPYYGDAGGDGLTALLNEHIVIAADLLTAAKANNTEGFNTANIAWYANGNDIAAYLNTANPDHFPLNDWQEMMKSHLDLTLEEATARLTGDYEADVIAYDKVYAELMMMADMLSDGIALQFPDKF